jgi:hypothetical protein
MDIMMGIAAATNAIKIAREIRDVSKDFANADVKAKVVDLVTDLSEAKLALVDAKERIQDLEGTIAELRGKLSFKADHTIRRSGLTYEVQEDGGVARLPLCPKCEGASNTFMRLVRKQDIRMAMCPNCGTEYSFRAVSYSAPDFAPAAQFRVTDEAVYSNEEPVLGPG